MSNPYRVESGTDIIASEPVIFELSSLSIVIGDSLIFPWSCAVPKRLTVRPNHYCRHFCHIAGSASILMNTPPTTLRA